MGWKDYFTNIILQRGYDYYLDGCVQDIQRNGNIIEAIVYGSEEYNVHIDLDDLDNMECDCPYFEGRDFCKHLAAVLYEIENEYVDDEFSSDIDSLIDSADEESVKMFLKQILHNNPKLETKFMSFIVEENSVVDISRYMRSVDHIIDSSGDSYGFINWQDSTEFTNRIVQFIHEEVNALVDSKHFKEAFRINNYIFQKLIDLNIDDSNGSVGEIADECVTVWYDILHACVDMDMRDEILDWFLGYYDQTVDYLQEYLDDVIFEFFETHEQLEKKMKFVDEYISVYSQYDDNWNSEFQLNKWIMAHIKILQDMNKPLDEIIQYANDHIELSRVRQFLIDHYMFFGEYEKAIELLKKSQDMDIYWRGRVKDYCEQLLSIYQELNMNQEYKEELWKYLEYTSDSFKVYKQLKELYTQDEWNIERNKLFENISINKPTLAKIYKEEKMHDLLFDYVLKTDDVFIIHAYEDVLKPLYENQLLEAYKNIVINKARNTSNRQTYQEIVCILRYMLAYTDGQQIVDDLVKDWRNRYRNRRAMMEELRRL